MKLPITPHLPDIHQSVIQHPISCVCADTGSGKSTQIPTYLAQHGIQCIVATPTVASVMNLVNFTKRHSPHIKVGFACGGRMSYTADDQVVYVTAGHLYRRLLAKANHSNPLGFRCLVLDEAHTVSTDYEVLRAAIRYCWRRRDFQLLISSATLSTEAIESQWSACAAVNFISVQVPSYEVKEVFHHRSYDLYSDDKLQIQDMVKEIVRYNQTLPPGHILVFLPGASDIDLMYRLLFEQQSLSNCDVYPAYATLPEFEIQQALNQRITHARQRSIILSTDMCETSVTIPGVVLVLDSGRQKVIQTFADGLGTKLTQALASRFALQQRKGRTGRTGPGICHRMFTQFQFQFISRDSYESEMTRTPIYQVVIELMTFHLNPVDVFPELQEKIATTIVYLQEQKLLDENHQVTPDAEYVTTLPLSLQEGLWAKRIRDSTMSRVEKVISILMVAIVQTNQNSGLVYMPRRQRDETTLQHDARCSVIRQKFIQKFFSKNDLASMSLAFLDYLYSVYWVQDSRRSLTQRTQSWCQENSFNSKQIRQTQKLTSRLITQVLGREITLEEIRQPFQNPELRTSQLEQIVVQLLPVLTTIYERNIFISRADFRGQCTWRSIHPLGGDQGYKIHKHKSICQVHGAQRILALSRIHIEKQNYVMAFLDFVIPLADESVPLSTLKQDLPEFDIRSDFSGSDEDM